MDTTQQKKKPKQPSNYVKTFRRGAIAANVFRRTAPGGFEYLDFSISRAWKTPSGKEGYSANFFAQHEEAICLVAKEACEWIREQQLEPSDAGEAKLSAAA